MRSGLRSDAFSRGERRGGACPPSSSRERRARAHGRDGLGQRSGRPHHPSRGSLRGRAVRRRQLRGDSRQLARGRALRLRARGLTDAHRSSIACGGRNTKTGRPLNSPPSSKKALGGRPYGPGSRAHSSRSGASCNRAAPSVPSPTRVGTRCYTAAACPASSPTNFPFPHRLRPPRPARSSVRG